MGLVAKHDGYSIVVYENNRLIASFDKDHLDGKYEGAFTGVDKKKSTAE
jgi:hypothetical protein